MADTKCQEYVAQLKELFPTSRVRVCDASGVEFLKARDFDAETVVIVEIAKVAKFRGTKDECLAKAKVKASSLLKPEFD